MVKVTTIVNILFEWFQGHSYTDCKQVYFLVSGALHDEAKHVPVERNILHTDTQNGSIFCVYSNPRSTGVQELSNVTEVGTVHENLLTDSMDSLCGYIISEFDLSSRLQPAHKMQGN